MKTYKPGRTSTNKCLAQHLAGKNLYISTDDDITQEEYVKVLNLDKINEMHEELGSGFLTVMQHILPGILLRPEKISQAFKIYNMEQVVMESHSLKSVCRQVGLLRMGELAARLESIVASGEGIGAESLIEQLISASVPANQALTKYCAGLDPAPSIPRKVLI
ncbi:MAG: Hpt domain-containing protein [Magnetococcus sp. YQC-5]